MGLGLSPVCGIAGSIDWVRIWGFVNTGGALRSVEGEAGRLPAWLNLEGGWCETHKKTCSRIRFSPDSCRSCTALGASHCRSGTRKVGVWNEGREVVGVGKGGDWYDRSQGTGMGSEG